MRIHQLSYYTVQIGSVSAESTEGRTVKQLRGVTILNKIQVSHRYQHFDLSQLGTDLHTCLGAVLRNLEHVELAYKAVNLYSPGKLHYDFVKHLKINQQLYKSINSDNYIVALPCGNCSTSLGVYRFRTYNLYHHVVHLPRFLFLLSPAVFHIT